MKRTLALVLVGAAIVFLALAAFTIYLNLIIIGAVLSLFAW